MVITRRSNTHIQCSHQRLHQRPFHPQISHIRALIRGLRVLIQSRLHPDRFLNHQNTVSIRAFLERLRVHRVETSFHSVDECPCCKPIQAVITAFELRQQQALASGNEAISICYEIALSELKTAFNPTV